MKILPAVMILLIVTGLVYAWTWDRGSKQLADLSRVSVDDMPTGWPTLHKKAPQLCIVLRLLRIDPFTRSAVAPQEAIQMGQRVATATGPNMLGGLTVSVLAAASLIGLSVAKMRKRRRSSALGYREPAAGFASLTRRIH